MKSAGFAIIVYIVIIALVVIKKAKKTASSGKSTGTAVTGTEETHNKSIHLNVSSSAAQTRKDRGSSELHALSHNSDGSHGATGSYGHKYTFCRHCGSQQCVTDWRCTSCGRRI